MYNNLLSKAVRNFKYFPGWKTSRKILVIESDDWGSIRMPSSQVFKILLSKGIPVERNPYTKYDSLASESDLSNLFEVLSSVKDMKGNYPVITANTILTNPDFNRIRMSQFQEYHYEIFTETLKRYPQHAGSFDLWKEGIKTKLFYPQFHGREHLNVTRWMKALRMNSGNVMLAFDNEMFDLSQYGRRNEDSFMQALDVRTEEELEFQKKSIEDGMSIFYKLFGYKSETFIAPSFMWSSKLNETLLSCGIYGLQGMWYQFEPKLGNEYGFSKKIHYTGQRNWLGQRYLVRNVSFEPSQDKGFNWIDDILSRMDTVFRWRKPVIMGAHRLNFIGSIDTKNRDDNLKVFKNLLFSIKKRYPDIEFMTSDRVLNLMQQNRSLL